MWRVAAVVFLNNRYHDPQLGRFISVDPLVSVTRSAYTYSLNKPIAFSDPTGLEAQSWRNTTNWAVPVVDDLSAAPAVPSGWHVVVLNSRSRSRTCSGAVTTSA